MNADKRSAASIPAGTTTTLCAYPAEYAARASIDGGLSDRAAVLTRAWPVHAREFLTLDLGSHACMYLESSGSVLGLGPVWKLCIKKTIRIARLALEHAWATSLSRQHVDIVGATRQSALSYAEQRACSRGVGTRPGSYDERFLPRHPPTPRRLPVIKVLLYRPTYVPT